MNIKTGRMVWSVCLIMSAALFVGCTEHGKWSLSEVDPTAARRDFQFQSLTLQRDGTYYAEADEGMGIESTSGTYTYENGVLALASHDGERHTYDAELMRGGRQLQLQRHWNGQRLTATFQRSTK